MPGQVGEDGALVVLLQPGPTQGSTCALPNGGILIGDQVILGLYTPNPVPNGTVIVAIEEFQAGTRTVDVPGPNGSEIPQSVPDQRAVAWSNVSIPGTPGDVGEYLLTVPSVQSQENLTIGILGVVEQLQIVVPGAGIAIPADYPSLLLHDTTFEVYVLAFVLIGIGLATAIRLRARHVDRLWPFGVVGFVSALAFATYAYSDYPASLVPIGSLPEAVVATPIVLVVMYGWLVFFPTEARKHKIEFAVADVDPRTGNGFYDEKIFRLYWGPDGWEYIGPGGNGATLRLLGIRTIWDDRVLTPRPYVRPFRGFRSIRHDVFAKYYAWAELPGQPKVLDVVRARVFLLPWRKTTRAAIEAYHRKELRGRVPAPTHVGLFLYVTPSRAFAAVTGSQGAVLAQGWISGTLQASRMGLALEKVLVAYNHLKVSLKAEAIDYGHKLALALRMAEDFPGSPVALKALEDLATRHEAAIADERTWFAFLEQKVQEDRTPTDRPGAVGAAEQILNEARNPVPPDLRRPQDRKLERGAA